MRMLMAAGGPQIIRADGLTMKGVGGMLKSVGTLDGSTCNQKLEYNAKNTAMRHGYSLIVSLLC